MKPQTPDNEVARLREKVAELEHHIKTQNKIAIEEYKILQRWKQHYFKADEEVARLRNTLEFIAADTATHDSTVYYRTLAQEALYQIQKLNEAK